MILARGHFVPLKSCLRHSHAPKGAGIKKANAFFKPLKRQNPKSGANAPYMRLTAQNPKSGLTALPLKRG